MTHGISALSYAVRFRVLGRYLGELCLMLALLNLVPAAVSLALDEVGFAGRWALLAGVLGALGVMARRLPEPEQIQSNEAVAVVALIFLAAPVLGAYPLAAAGMELPDALFEAVSAVTTTGLSTAGPPEANSPAMLFARAWMQWYGGLGIAVLSVALLLGNPAAARRLVEPPEGENIASTARNHARQALIVYLILSGGGLLALWGATGDGWSALLHMLSTVSTGGFAPVETSLGALTGSSAAIITAFSLLGAVPLVLYFHAARRGAGIALRDPEVRALAAAGGLVCLCMTVSLATQMRLPWLEAVGHGAMMGISAQSTTGFASLSVSELDPVSKLVLMAAMFVGGGTGSTAGGVKLLRLLVMLRLLQHFVRRTSMPPHATMELRLADRPLAPVDVERAALVMTAWLAAAVLSWLAFLAYGYPPLDAVFEITSALGTVGLSTGIASPELEKPLKLLLCLDMLLGRLELLALLVLVYPRTWIGRRI